MKKWFKEKILTSNKNTLSVIGGVCFFFLLILQIVMLCYGTYFNSNSDDIVQYSPILNQYIQYAKSGNFGMFNFTNNLGSSVFADVYYVPFDIFTLLIFLLSFVMDGYIAFSIVNLSKLLFGVIIFAYFLQRKGFKNWIVLILSFIYFSVGGSWIFQTYPTYFSLFVYLPLSLVIVDVYNKGKKWVLPLYCFGLILYNFYNAYTLFIFMVFVYIVVQIRDDYNGIKNLIKKVIMFGLHIILSVIMGLFVLLPTVLYILNYSVRTSSEFVFLYEPMIYFKMIYKLFIYETGVSTFAFTGDYIHYQFNYYVGILGLFCLGLLFLMKDRTSKIYKWTIVAVVGMMLFPVFSMLFSGILIPYTRWFSFINIILIYFIGHVLSNVDFNEINRKSLFKVGAIIIGLYVCVFVTNILIIVYSKINNDSLISVNVALILYLILFGIFLMLYCAFGVVKKYDLVKSVFVLEMLVAICINFSSSFDNKQLQIIKLYDSSNNILNKINMDDDELSRVYIKNDFGKLPNTNRVTDIHINEKTFHSFMSKYVYGYQTLFKDDGIIALSTNYLNRYNPNNSRVMDYKYIIFEKDKVDYSLDYLSVYYEDDEYIIYKNDMYEPFYIYEDYYRTEEVLNFNDENMLLYFEKALLKGVVLEEDKYNLNKIDYENSDKGFNRVNVITKIIPNKIGDNNYEIYFEDYTKFGYTGSIYLKIDQYENIESISAFSNNNDKKCDFQKGLYKCDYDGVVEKIVLKANESIEELSFVVEVKEDEEKYIILSLEENINNSKYLSFYNNSNADIILKKGLDTKRKCLQGLCVLMDYDHALYGGSFDVILSEDDVFVDYRFENLDYYFENNDNSSFGINKSLTYKGSTINVKYQRTSASNNDQIAVLPITYSEEWICEDDNYELVKANGGFLGILVKNGIEDIDLSITFKPGGVKAGLIGSIVGFGIYGLYVVFIVLKNKKEKENNDI